MGEKLKLEVRERPDVIQSFRLLPSEAEQLKKYAVSHGAKATGRHASVKRMRK